MLKKLFRLALLAAALSGAPGQHQSGHAQEPAPVLRAGLDNHPIMR